MKRLISFILALSLLTPSITYASDDKIHGAGDGDNQGGTLGATKGTSWRSSDYGYRIYIIDNSGNVVSNVVDIINKNDTSIEKIEASLNYEENGQRKYGAEYGYVAPGLTKLNRIKDLDNYVYSMQSIGMKRIKPDTVDEIETWQEPWKQALIRNGATYTVNGKQVRNWLMFGKYTVKYDNTTNRPSIDIGGNTSITDGSGSTYRPPNKTNPNKNNNTSTSIEDTAITTGKITTTLSAIKAQVNESLNTLLNSGWTPKESALSTMGSYINNFYQCGNQVQQQYLEGLWRDVKENLRDAHNWPDSAQVSHFGELAGTYSKIKRAYEKGDTSGLSNTDKRYLITHDLSYLKDSLKSDFITSIQYNLLLERFNAAKLARDSYFAHQEDKLSISDIFTTAYADDTEEVPSTASAANSWLAGLLNGQYGSNKDTLWYLYNTDGTIDKTPENTPFTKYIAEKHYRVVIEPVYWFVPQVGTGSGASYTPTHTADYTFYGTLYDYAWYMMKFGASYFRTNGGTNHSMLTLYAPQAMFLSGDTYEYGNPNKLNMNNIFRRNTNGEILDTDGNVMRFNADGEIISDNKNPSIVIKAQPTPTSNIGFGTTSQQQIGYGLSYYEFEPLGTPSPANTKTYDEHFKDTPEAEAEELRHKAPRPNEEEWIAKGADPKTWKYNIIKVYETYYLKDNLESSNDINEKYLEFFNTDEAKIYTHKFDATKYETTEPGIINVLHEDEYKVVGAITSMRDLSQYKPNRKVDGGLVYSDGSEILSAEDSADLSYINNGSDWFDIKSAVEKLDPTTVKYASTYSLVKQISAGSSMTRVVLGPENIAILTGLSNTAIENFENELAGTGYRPLDLFWLNNKQPEYLSWSEEMKNKVIAAAEKHLNLKIGTPTPNNSEITYEDFIGLLGYRMSLENLENHTTLYVHLIRIDELSATHTFDKITNPGGNPHPAPDPRNDPDPEYRQSIEDNDPYLKYRIVKVYEEAYEGFENDPSKINTVSINITEPTVNKIDIQDEPEYKVIEYTYGYPGVNVREQTNYEDMLINARRLHSEILDDMINENKYNIGIPDDSNNDKSGLMYNDINAIKRYKITDKDREESKDGVLTQVNIFDVNQVTNQVEDETSTLFVRLRKIIPTPGTNTWDNKEYPEGDPGPAPEVIPDPKLPDIYKYRIVKVYETEDTETGEINTVEVNERTNVPPRIQIDDEPYYKLVEWVYGEPNNPVTPTSTWNTVTNGVPNTNHGTKPEEVNIADGNKVTTLYVRLRRKIVTPPPALDEDLTESQLTKISNTNSTTFGWAGYTWTASIAPAVKSHLYTVHIGSCGKCGDPEGSACDGHCADYTASCSHMTRSRGDNYISATFGVQIGDRDSHETNVKVANAHPDFAGKMMNNKKTEDTILLDANIGDSSYSYTLNSNGENSEGIEYITTISRSSIGDLPNLAKYKKNAVDGSSYNRVITVFKESNTPTTSRTSNGAKNENIRYIFGHITHDNSATSSCLGCGCSMHHGVNSDTKIVYYNMEKLTLDGSFKIYTYAGDKAKTAKTTSTLADGFYVRHGSSDTNISRLFHSQQSATIKFYPYIRMSYMITKDNIGFKDFNSFEGYRANPKSSNSRTVYMLSTKQSTIVPTNAVEVSWNNDAQRKNGAYGLQMTSQQWSTHNRATTGDEWRKPNQVLPGGALYYLNTSGTESTIKTVTYNTLVDNDSRTWISVSNPEKYTIPSIIKSTQNYLNEAENVMENYRIVQWVNRDWNLTNAWDGQTTNRVKIKTGGESLSNLGMSHKASTDSKYLLINGGDKNDVAEGDIDIINKVYTTNIYKGYTNTNGDIYMAWVEVKSSSNKLDEATLTKAVNYLKQLNGTDTPTGSLDSNMQYHSPIKIGTKKNSKEAILENLKNTNYGIYTMDQKTGYVSNLIDSVERNTGMDKNATWLEVRDGKWYNEAFDGYYMVVQEAYYQVGLRVPNRRMSVLDPNLCPKNTGVSDLFSTAFISQFRINEKSTVAEDKEDGYLGTFEDMRVIIPDLPLLMYSRPFYIPNVNVQDLT